MRLFAASVLFLCTALAHGQSASSPSAAQPSSAAVQSPGLSSYRSDVLRLTYSYPSNFVDASNMVNPAMEASLGQDPAAAAAARCISLPFSRMAQGTGKIDLVLLIRQDGGCAKHKFDAKSVLDITRAELQSLTQAGARPNFAAPVSYKLATRPATMLQGSFTLPTGQVMQAMVACVLTQPDIACWQFLSSSTSGLATLSSLPVTFDGSPATALVPPAVLEGK